MNCWRSVLFLALFSMMFVASASANPIGITESAGACEAYNELAGTSGDKPYCSEGPNYDVCGSVAGQERAHVKGPAVNETVISNYPSHYYACLAADEYSHCVLPSGEEGTNKVPEGTLANVAQNFNDAADDYQNPENSPDWSVCLATDSSTPGGQWYSLDNSNSEAYLKNGGSGLLDGDDDTDIDTFWRSNPNPQDDEHNPEGEKEGLTLEDDCDDDLTGCENTLKDNGLFYSFFSHSSRDKDYNPEGGSSEGDDRRDLNPQPDGPARSLRSLFGLRLAWRSNPGFDDDLRRSRSRLVDSPGDSLRSSPEPTLAPLAWTPGFRYTVSKNPFNPGSVERLE